MCCCHPSGDQAPQTCQSPIGRGFTPFLPPGMCSHELWNIRAVRCWSKRVLGTLWGRSEQRVITMRETNNKGSPWTSWGSAELLLSGTRWPGGQRWHQRWQGFGPPALAPIIDFKASDHQRCHLGNHSGDRNENDACRGNPAWPHVSRGLASALEMAQPRSADQTLFKHPKSS